MVLPVSLSPTSPRLPQWRRFSRSTGGSDRLVRITLGSGTDRSKMMILPPTEMSFGRRGTGHDGQGSVLFGLVRPDGSTAGIPGLHVTTTDTDERTGGNENAGVSV